MEIKLAVSQKTELESRHQVERDKRVCDRIKAILLRDEGWSITKIAQALRLHNDTVSRHIMDYIRESKLEPLHKGSDEKLSNEDAEKLIKHLEEHTYLKVADICDYVLKNFEIEYTVGGMTEWLKRHRFSYKNPKPTPAKADEEKQRAFIKEYNELKAKTPVNEPIFFMDSVHPTMATKVACGWIRKGQDKPIATTASRTRLNITGAIELSGMKTVINEYQTIDGDSTLHFLEQVKNSYQEANKIHFILDQSGYHRSKKVMEYAEKNGIELHFLPPYSPNLNPIERLWKVMNEQVRNNVYFNSAKIFKESVMDFFTKTLPDIALSLSARINDNFQILKPANSF